MLGTRYTSTRDAGRAIAQRPPRWTNTTNRLAAQMWERQECSWAMAVKIMWDKHVTGDNERKWGCREVARCPVCNAITSQRHTITKCGRPGAEMIRRKAVQNLDTAIEKQWLTLVGRTLAAVRRLLSYEEGYTIWTGMWTQAIREEIARECPWTLTSREFKQVKRALSNLVTGVIALYRLAGPTMCKRQRGEDEAGSANLNGGLDKTRGRPDTPDDEQDR